MDLSFYPDAVCLGVQDNGTGFDLEAVKARGKEKAFGLAGMEGRVQLLGGTFTVRSQKGEGVAVEVRIPTPQGSSTLTFPVRGGP